MLDYERLKAHEIKIKNEPVHGASYITSDGLYIDMSVAYEQRIIIPNSYGVPLHMDLDKICVAEFQPEVCRDVLKYINNDIKIQDGALIEKEHPYVDLPSNNPNKKQYDALELWLFALAKSNKKNVFVKINNIVNETFDLSQSDPKDVINYIKKSYASL